MHFKYFLQKGEIKMKKNIGKTLVITGLCASLAATPLIAFASENGENTLSVVSQQENEIQPRVNWTGTAYLSKGKWCNVTSSNNIFPDKPQVTNASGNKGTIEVRIINEKGEIVGSKKTIKVGKTVTLDNIPAFSGTYTLQAKAIDKSGTYTISID